MTETIPPAAPPTVWGRVKDVLASIFGFVPAPIRNMVLRHKIASGITSIVLVLLTFGYMAVTKEPVPEYITATVERGDIVQTVEAVGTVTSERDLNLQFPVSGVVAEILVKEGDKVEAGDRLAALRANDLNANVNSAAANLQAAQADLREMQEGTRPEDIAIAEAEVANKRAQLTAAEDRLTSAERKLKVLQDEARITLGGQMTTARSAISQQLTAAKNALTVVDDVMDDSEVYDAITKAEPGAERLIRQDYDRVYQDIQSKLWSDSSFDDYTDALQRLRSARTTIADAYDIVEDLFSLVSSVPPTANFSRSEREARKTDLTTEKSSLQSGLSSIDTQIKNLQDASASFDTKIAAEESTITASKGDILNLETSLRTQEAQLALKRAGSRQTDIDAAAARVRQAQADLQRTQASLSDTVLNAPVTGSITKVNIKTGELLSTAFQQDAAITMLGESPYRIEMYVSEIDIPKVVLEQEAQVELDAFPDQPFPLYVAEVDPAATSVDGVPKYRLKLDFIEVDPAFKIGMTGDVDIFTGKSEDVLMVPARAVIEGEDGNDVVRVLKDDGTIEQRPVEVGLEGENDIEIRTGVEEGETIVVLIKE